MVRRGGKSVRGSGWDGQAARKPESPMWVRCAPHSVVAWHVAALLGPRTHAADLSKWR